MKNPLNRKFLLLSVFLLLTLVSLAQVKVKGTIKDDNTGETIVGATVILKGSTTGGLTDIDGKFEFIVPESPPFVLVVSYLGFQTQEFKVTSPNQKIQIGLSTDEVLMSEIEVVGDRISEKQKQSPLTIESMDILAIKETPASDFYEGLGQLKGIDLTTASIGFKVINCRGFNSTSPVRSLQIIDGVDNQSPGLNFSLGNFLGAAEIDVMKMDIIVGASSAYYGPNAFNGVISMTTKNPFQFPGLTVLAKVAERNLLETSVRYAHVFQNKKGEDKFAVKFNLLFMRADDWEAENMDTASGSLVGVNNPGGYDAVNRYGDENLSTSNNNASSTTGQITNPGLGVWHRTGYVEKDLVDYNARNVKLGLAFHYKLKPDVELIYASNFGTGTTVYQGDNRYSLKNILFFQNRLELRKKDKYFIRAYATNEDAGKSYDAVFTAFLLQDAAKDDASWSKDYRNYWGNNIIQGAPLLDLPGFPIYVFPDPVLDWLDSANVIMELYPDSLTAWHQRARDDADNSGGTPFYKPGTAAFDSAFKSITSIPLSKGGTRFVDKSALYHLHGQYKFTPEFMDITVGGNFRLYIPNSEGSIFSDTGDVRITNYEYGVYAGLEKKILDEKVKLNLTSRLDKNQNFDFVMSPALSVVYTYSKNHIARLSFSSAIRNPTLADQYLYYNVGRAILVGNIKGRDSLVTVSSLVEFLNSGNNPDTLVYFNVAPVRPEKVKSIEIGYRTTLFNRIYLDASYYFSWYKDFLGYKIGIDAKLDDSLGTLSSAQGYRVAANSDDMVTTQGFSVGINYFFKKFFAINGNYSWNKIDLRGSEDPIIPAYNTPEHKFNIGMSGRDIIIKIGSFRLSRLGFSVNYKWIEGFKYEGSPQFTGFVPTYDMLDMQINKYFPKLHMTAKLGASNILNNKQFQVYGGPRIGRMAYFSILVELDPFKRKKKKEDSEELGFLPASSFNGTYPLLD